MSFFKPVFLYFASFQRDHVQRLLRRMVQYSAVGIGTFLLDLAIIQIAISYFGASDAVALAIGFAIGVTTNYLLSYYWVYRGTKRSVAVGYIIFTILALLGVVFVIYATIYLAGAFGLPLLVARTIIATFVGIVNFFINTFFNFKLV